jgi:hypothetical protein
MKLEDIKFRVECSVPWASMAGNDRVRYCSQCRLNAYNLSSMSREEAESFMSRTLGSACVQLYRRPDGTVITSDCSQIVKGEPPPIPTAGIPMPPKR